MCGIFLYKSSNKVKNINKILEAFSRIKRRGPDNSSFLQVRGDEIFLGFHRLSINDLSSLGNQPFFTEKEGTGYGTSYLMCNGEIYNHSSLESEYDIKPESKSDCEFLLPYFQKNKYLLKKAFSKIDGVFATAFSIKNSIVAGRDRYGVKPLFYSIGKDHLVIASEAKAIDQLGYEPIELPPGSYIIFDPVFYTIVSHVFYYQIQTSRSIDCSESDCISTINNLLTQSVRKRLMSDREVSCLLSGGLDSSLISSILSKELKKEGKKLKTYSIGFPDSTDIKYARKVSEFIGSEHYELIIQYEDALKRIADVVEACETYDITTIRASTPMYLLCEYISTFKNPVVFSGEGSDEVFAGYLYFHKAPDCDELNKESIRLISNLWKYDVLRADRCTSENGLDLREPFLDRDLIDFMCGLDPKLKQPKDGYEKWILRKAFDNGMYLPDEVLWRRKAAFSDAVSSSEKPWYMYIKEHVNELLGENPELFNKIDFPTEESAYYNYLFKKKFFHYNPKIEYWLPKWNDEIGVEPSATALSIYKKEEH